MMRLEPLMRRFVCMEMIPKETTSVRADAVDQIVTTVIEALGGWNDIPAVVESLAGVSPKMMRAIRSAYEHRTGRGLLEMMLYEAGGVLPTLATARTEGGGKVCKTPSGSSRVRKSTIGHLCQPPQPTRKSV